MPSPLIPIQKGAAVDAAALWANFLSFHQISGLTFTDADTVDGHHATSIPASGVVPVTDGSGYLPTGFINPTSISGLAANLYIERNPAAYQTAVRGKIENDTTASTFIVANISTGNALEGISNGAGTAGKLTASGISGIAADLVFAGASGTGTNALLKATFTNGASRPFAEFFNASTKVFAVDTSGGVKASGDLEGYRVRIQLPSSSVAPIVTNSSGLNENLNADLLDGHHYSELASLVSAATGFVPVSGGTFTGRVNFNEIEVVSTYDDRSPVRIWSQAVTSDTPVQSWTVAGTQDVWRAYSSASAISGDLLARLDSNGNIWASGYGDFKTLNLRAAVSGGPVITTDSSGLNTGLNADLLDGLHASDFVDYTDAILTHPEEHYLDGVQTGVHSHIRSETFGLPAFYAENSAGGRAGVFTNTGGGTDEISTNGDIEVFSAYDYGYGSFVGLSWVPFNTEAPTYTLFLTEGNYYAPDSTQKYHGNYSQRVIRSSELGNGHIGIAQSVTTAVSGESYDISIYGLMPSGINGNGLGLAVNSSGTLGISNATHLVTSPISGQWVQLALTGVIAQSSQISIMPYLAVSGNTWGSGSIVANSFEETTHAATSPYNFGQVTNGWTDFTLTGVGASSGVTAGIIVSSGVLFSASGNSYNAYNQSKAVALTNYNTTGISGLGVRQAVTVVSGTQYYFRGKFINPVATVAAKAVIGIDPAGGTNPHAATVIWKSKTLAGAAGSGWEDLTTDAYTASGTSLTLFAGLSGLNNAIASNYYMDYIQMSVGPVVEVSGTGWFDLLTVSGASAYGQAVPPLYAESDINNSQAAAAEFNTANGNLTGGIPPIKTNSQSWIENLNVDMLDGLHAADLVISGMHLLTINNEVISGVNGTASGFDVAWGPGYTATSLKVHYNGLLNVSGVDYVETNPASGIFTFYVPPTSGSLVTVDYLKN